MKTPYKLLLSLAFTFASVIAPSLTGSSGDGSASLHAQTIGEAFYIYRNDGQINGFLRGEIDSIAYSNYDLDSLLHDDVVTQVIFTEDSTYRIPLEAIDSVSFVTPKTEYKPGVIDLSENLMPYIMSCDSMTITFSGSTPSDLLPRVGDKLMTLDMNEIFPAGFAGEVIEVSGNSIICKRVPLEDIFETYYNVTSAYGYIEDEGGEVKSYLLDPINKSWAKDFKFNTFTIPFTAELSRSVVPNSDLALKGGAGLSVEITPTFHVRATLIVSREEGTYFSASVTGEANIKEKLSIYGGIEWSHDFFDKAKIEEPIAPFVNFLFNPGIFLRASATASLSTVFEQDYTFGWGRDWSSKGRNVLRPSNGGRLRSWDFDVEGCVDGSIGVGGYVEIGVALLHSELDKLVFRGELGGEFVSHAVLYNSDIADASAETRAYERFKQSSFDVNVFVNTSLQAQLVGGLWGGGVSLPWNLSYQLKTWYVVPQFSDMQYEAGDDLSEALVSARVSRDLISPMTVGMALFDGNKQLVEKQQASSQYKTASIFSNPLTLSFTGLTPGKRYTVYPYIQVMGYEYLASPSLSIGEDVIAETGEVTEITSKTATIAGRVTGEDASRHEFGVYYIPVGSEDWKSIRAKERSNEGVFSVQLDGLEKDTEYAYCTYVNMGTENLYGDVLKFRTAKGMAVITGDATEITDSSAVLHGQLSDYEIDQVKEYGISYSTSPDDIQYVPASFISNDGSFSVKLSGLTEQTKYYYAAYAYINDDEEEYYGEAMNFTTSEQKNSTVTTGEATEITSTSAVLSGRIQNYDATAVTEYGIKYILEGNEPNVVSATNIVDGTFSVELSNLTPQKTYTYYAYIILRGIEVCGEAKTFTVAEAPLCPDANHPHMIDLGIGTLWACCNVGASSPEQYGNYYAWGETQPKSVYNWDTYKYYKDALDVPFCSIYIGSDISGTQYDAARVNWGAPWRMPTLAECRDLVNKCSSEWTSVNGVYGRKFTGPNGGTIFLPAAGSRYNSGLSNAGSYGNYWSSTLSEINPDGAYYLDFFWGGAYWRDYCLDGRGHGHSVRPVR